MVSIEYISGFFDGEGYISLHRCNRKRLRVDGRYRYWLIVQFTNTHKEVMEEIHKVVGGSMLFHKGDKGLKPHYRVTLYCREACKCLKLMLPYLIVKKEEAECAIKFQESMRPWRLHVGVPLTEAEYDFQAQCHLTLKLMHGGKVTATV